MYVVSVITSLASKDMKLLTANLGRSDATLIHYFTICSILAIHLVSNPWMQMSEAL